MSAPPGPATGTYTIVNVKFKNLAVLPGTNKEVVGKVEDNGGGEKWNITKLESGKYRIENHVWRRFAACESFPAKEDSVEGRQQVTYWKIKECPFKGRFTIAPADANAELFWGLAHGKSGTPITLEETPTAPRNQWTFHPATVDSHSCSDFIPAGDENKQTVPVDPSSRITLPPASRESGDDHARSGDPPSRRISPSANSASALQTALGLVAYIEDSIELFRSNREEIKSTGFYSRRLSEQLSRAVDANKTESFVRVIQAIRAYVEKIAKTNGIVQCLQRRQTAQTLQGYRDNLWDEFAVFNIKSEVNIQQAQQDAESAMQNDERMARDMLKNLSKELTSTSVGVRDLALSLGLAKANEKSRKETLRELQDIKRHNEEGKDTSSMTQEEIIIVDESIQLTQLILSPNYKWFRETFNSAKFSQSEVKNVLAENIDDVIRDLSDANLLARSTVAEINHESNSLRQVSLLFRVMDARSRDAVLVRAFQRALSRVDGMDAMLKEGLV